MSESSQSGRVLVTGAGGVVGRELTAMLEGAGALVRAAVHRRDDLVPEKDLDIDRVVVDFAAPDTLLAALRDVEVLYLLTPQVPETVAQVTAAVAAARACGVRRIVRQSLCNADTGRDALSRWHREAESVIAASGLAYTFLRPNSFMQNFVTIYGPSIRDDDRFRLPLGAAAMSSVDARDVAAAATAVLIDEVDADIYTLTGPQALTGAEMATVLAGVTSRPITYVDEPEDAGRPQTGEAQHGTGEAQHETAEAQHATGEEKRVLGESRRAVSEALREFGAEMRAGRLAAVTGDVERLTGRPTISFAQFARDYGWAFAKPSRDGVPR
jgi:uncharacterized protein YbjT (DUF2867 family)